MMQRPPQPFPSPIFARPARRRRARIEIVPMIDTIFFLLVFFIIFSLSLTQQAGIGVEAPEGGTPLPESRRVVVAIPAQGTLLVDGQPVSERDLPARLVRALGGRPDSVAVIVADARVRHGRVVQVLEAARQAGAAHFAIGTSGQRQ